MVDPINFHAQIIPRREKAYNFLIPEHLLHDAHGGDDQDLRGYWQGGAGGHQAGGRQARQQCGHPPRHRC